MQPEMVSLKIKFKRIWTIDQGVRAKKWIINLCTDCEHIKCVSGILLFYFHIIFLALLAATRANVLCNNAERTY